MTETKRYSKIMRYIWNDAKFRALSWNAKGVFLFVLTHPNITSIGALRATVTGLAEERAYDLQREAFADAFGEALDKGLLEYDPEACLIIAPNYPKHNKPQSINVVKGWANSIELLPECELLSAHINRLKALTNAMPLAFRHAFTLDKRTQEQEQKQEQNVKTPTPLKEESPKGEKLKKEKGIPEPKEYTDLPEFFQDVQFFAQWQEYETMRRQKKKPYTAIGRRRGLAKLWKLSGQDIAKATELVDGATEHQWLSFFKPDNGRGVNQNDPQGILCTGETEEEDTP